MTYTVLMEPQAHGDAMSAWSFIAAHSVSAADRWFAGLIERVESLAQRPEQYPLAAEWEGSNLSVRRLLYGKYKILYDIKGNTVRVLRIYHGSRFPLSPEDFAP